MNASKGAMYFHPLYSVQDLGFGNPEPFVGRLIREFLRIGESVAGRWIEMPHAILFLQMVSGEPDSGAIYLYDRRQQILYMVCFDGEDDHLTLEDFNSLLSEYNLLRYAEQPSLAQSQPPMPERQFHHTPSPAVSAPKGVDLATSNCAPFTTENGVRWYVKACPAQFDFQSVASA